MTIFKAIFKAASPVAIFGTVVFYPSIVFASDSNQPTTYQVVQEDSLSLIQDLTNVPWQELAELNHLKAPYTIVPGQTLKLPKASPLSHKKKVKDPSGRADRIKFKRVPTPDPILLKSSSKAATPISDKPIISKGNYRYNLDPKLNSKESLKAAALLGPMFGIKYIGGYASSGHSPKSQHYLGLALDFGTTSIPNGHAVGDELVAYVIAHHKELNIRYVIFWEQIWFPGRGWSAYSGASDHRDHVHLSFDGYSPVTHQTYN